MNSDERVAMEEVDLLEALRDGISPNRNARKRALKNIESVKGDHGYVEGLLVALCGSVDGVDENVQEFACSLLEKHIRSHYREYSQELKVEVKKDSLVAMGSRSQPIRQAVAGVIAALAQDPEGWPNLRPTLEASFESPDLNVIEGAMNTLARLLSEDAVSLLEWIAPLLPKITQCLQHPHPPLRAFAIECAQHLGTAGCRVVLDSIADIVQIVLDNMREGNEEVYTSVCQFLMFACTVDFGLLQPQLSAIIQFMIDKVLDDDKNLGTSAACCLVFLLERDQELETWLPHLPNLIPAVLKGMVYEDKTVALLGGDREYENTVDKMDQMALAEPSNVQSMDDEEEEEAVDYNNQDNLRKGCAFFMDEMSMVFGDEILQFFVPQVKLMLSSEDWKTVETAVLALGTIAEGCPEVLTHFPQIVRTIISLLSHKKPLIRSISSWTLSRHVKWIASNHNDLLQSLILDSMLKVVLDSHPHVQDTALGALKETTEAISEFLVPYVNYILETLALALHSCPKTNLLILCDAITSLLESVEVDYNDKKYIEVIMPPMMEKLAIVDRDIVELIAFLEPFSVLADKFKSGFLPYCPVVFEKCATSISTLLQQIGDEDRFVKLLPSCLDLIMEMVEGVKGDLVPLLNRSDVIAHLIVCLKMNDDDVLQSGFALLGDLADFCYDAIRAQVNEIVILCEAEMRKLEDTPSLSNAVWSLGKIIEKMGMEAMPYAETWLQILFTILQPPEMPGTMVNAVYTISNLAVACPEVVAPHLPILGPLCFDGMLEADEEEMKETVVFGLFTMIAVNPVAIEKDTLLQLLLSIEVSDRLKEATQLGVTKFCSVRNESFTSMLEDLPSNDQETLKEKYDFLADSYVL